MLSQHIYINAFHDVLLGFDTCGLMESLPHGLLHALLHGVLMYVKMISNVSRDSH